MPKTYSGGLLITRELSGFVYAKSHEAARRRFRVPNASAVDWDTAYNDPKRPSNARIYFVVDRVTAVQSAREAARAEKRNARFFGRYWNEINPCKRQHRIATHERPNHLKRTDKK